MQWPRDGIPDHPASGLMATAKHLAADQHRRKVNLNRKLAIIAQQRSTTGSTESDPMATVDEDLDIAVHDDLLRLIFTA